MLQFKESSHFTDLLLLLIQLQQLKAGINIEETFQERMNRVVLLIMHLKFLTNLLKLSF